MIGIGSVVPHTDAGWLGGCKIILPGPCSEQTVIENHILCVSFPSNMLGQPSTAIRENMEGIVEKIGLDYVLNVAMTPYGDVVDVLGGHFVAAQREATVHFSSLQDAVDACLTDAGPDGTLSAITRGGYTYPIQT